MLTASESNSRNYVTALRFAINFRLFPFHPLSAYPGYSSGEAKSLFPPRQDMVITVGSHGDNVEPKECLQCDTLIVTWLIYSMCESSFGGDR